MNEDHRLDGQTAIVTGAAQGIGQGIALVLSEAGANIVIGDIQDASDTVRQIEQKGGHAVAMVMDTSRPSDAEALVELALQPVRNSLDVLVNNAGIDAPRGTIWGLTDEEWQRTIDVNLSGVFYCTRAALKPMLAAGSGCIVNISSQAARAAGDPNGSPAYNASKAGLIGLTIASSAQVAAKGVRVNAIMPALVESRDFGWSAGGAGRPDKALPPRHRRPQRHRPSRSLPGQPGLSMGNGHGPTHHRRLRKKRPLVLAWRNPTQDSQPPHRCSRLWRPLHNRHSGKSRNPESHDLAMSRVVLPRHLNAIR